MNKDLQEILEKLIEFRDKRNWKQFHTPENLAKSISIEASELLENYQWGSQNASLDNIKEEVADIFGYLLLLCNDLEIDLLSETRKKIAVNSEKYPVAKAYGKSDKYEKKASDIIKEKLNRLPNRVAHIEQINGSITNLYYITQDTFWSDNLNRLIGDGYSFELFDILQKESYRFHNNSIPKGNARFNKLGDVGCDMDTCTGILGYKFFNKSTGDSILDPIHVIAAILDWAGVAKNERGYIRFLLNN